jgi:NAD-dependent SIR2 family protein deacetylase
VKYFYCEDCDELFSEEAAGTKSVYDGYGELDYYACPNCGSTELCDADYCEICGEPMAPTSADVCNDCTEALNKAWTNVVETVMDRRLKAGNNLSDDYLDCQDGAIVYLENVGVI